VSANVSSTGFPIVRDVRRHLTCPAADCPASHTSVAQTHASLSVACSPPGSAVYSRSDAMHSNQPRVNGKVDAH